MRRPSTQRSAVVVLLAVAVAMALWALIRLLGVEPAVVEGAGLDPVGPVDVAAAAAVAGLAAWGVHAWLARRGAASRWPIVASAALVASMLGPSSMARGASAAALICLHLAVGAVLIAGFARTLPRAHRSA